MVRQTNKASGFSLPELLTTVTISAVLMAMAIPSLFAMFQSNKIASFASDFRSAIYQAQSEAIKRNATIAITPINRDGKNWLVGWEIFQDSNENGLRNTGDELIATYNFEYPGYTLKAVEKTFKRWIHFDAMGSPVGSNDDTDGSFRLCPSNADTDNARTITLSLSGNIAVTEGAIRCP